MPITRLVKFLLVSFVATILAVVVMPRKSQALALCSVSMSNFAFGSIDVLPGTAISTSGTISVACGLDLLQGNIFVCVPLPARTMPGTPALAWDIFGPPNLTTSWSNTAQLVVPGALVGLGNTDTFTIQASVLAGQGAVLPGSYSQTITTTATWGSTDCTHGGLLSTGTSTFSFTASATVAKSCNISALNLAFNSAGDLNTVINGQSTLTVQCTQNTGYLIGLDGGLSGATDPTARFMKAGSASIRYGLYQPPAGTTPWGNTTASSVAGIGNTMPQSLIIFGRIPIQPTPPPATYSDTIIATVTY